MSLIKTFKSIAGTEWRGRGTVMSVNGSLITVVGRNGRIQATRAPGDATVYAVGDKVSVAAGSVIGRVDEGEVYSL